MSFSEASLRAVLALSAAGVCACPTVARAQAESRALLLRHADVIDVRAGRVLHDQSLVIEGTRITNSGPAASVRVPAGVTVIDASGQFLIPGLWDMHVHAAWPQADSLFAPLFVANGVTGVREMFGAMDIIKRWKANAARGEWPLMVASGHIVDGPNPELPGSAIAASPEQARHLVDSLHAAGADFIKILQRVSRDTYIAVLAEAKRQGTYVAGHVPYPITVAEASDLGQRTIEHLTYVGSDCSTEADALRAERIALRDDTSSTRIPDYMSQGPRIIASYDAARCGALAATLARNKTWQVPTLVVSRSYAYLDDDRFTADPRMRYMPAEFATMWSWQHDPRLRSFTAADWASNRRVHQHDLKIVGELYRAGVPIMAGTDVLNPFAFPGFSLHDELVLLVQAGLSNADALRAATLNPAVFLNATDSLGTVSINKRADLVLLDANPLADISNTQKVRAVVFNGRYYNRVALDSMLAAAERRAHGR